MPLSAQKLKTYRNLWVGKEEVEVGIEFSKEVRKAISILCIAQQVASFEEAVDRWEGFGKNSKSHKVW